MIEEIKCRDRKTKEVGIAAKPLERLVFYHSRFREFKCYCLLCVQGGWRHISGGFQAATGSWD
ncbi:MAG: hypothetical protein FWG10_13410 [Eubacteriaceae bacterium]|nr:hypothetical protein [Eubacteriaceae bacterium]